LVVVFIDLMNIFFIGTKIARAGGVRDGERVASSPKLRRRLRAKLIGGARRR
jgi:hypothetical protein